MSASHSQPPIPPARQAALEIPAQLRRLPPFPPVAVRLMAASADAKVDFKEISALLEADPVLSAEILRLANSPLFGARARISTIPQAVAMLGLARVRTVGITAAMDGYFLSRDGNGALRECWRHSVATATIAAALASRAGRGLAYSAGLTHDIGRLALLRMDAAQYVPILAKQHGTVANVLWTERSVFGIHHCQAGAWIARTWHLPESLCVAAEFHHAPYVPVPYLQAVCVACELASVLGFASVRVVERDTGEALIARLPAGALARGSGVLFEELRDQVNEALGAFDPCPEDDGA